MSAIRGWRRWGLRVIGGCLLVGAVGITPASAQSIPPGMVVIPPIVPAGLTMPLVLPTMSGGDTRMSRTGLTWSKAGRADVDVDIDRQHGRELVP